jgi:helix-turn-helix protein
MVDKPWEEGAIKVIRKAQVPVVPIYFHAKNSWLFYFLSKIAEPFVLYSQSFSEASCYKSENWKSNFCRWTKRI